MALLPEVVSANAFSAIVPTSVRFGRICPLPAYVKSLYDSKGHAFHISSYPIPFLPRWSPLANSPPAVCLPISPSISLFLIRVIPVRLFA